MPSLHTAWGWGPAHFAPVVKPEPLKALEVPQPRSDIGRPSLLQAGHLEQIRYACAALERSAEQLAKLGKLPVEYATGVTTLIREAAEKAAAAIAKTQPPQS